MKLYVDTNALVRAYVDPDQTGETERILFAKALQFSTPIPVPTLLRLEFTNAVERMAFESSHGGQWRVSREVAGAAQASFEEHLRGKQLFASSSLSLEDIEPLFVDLSQRHTARRGFRTYDILHVCYALALECDRFLSFDKQARELAELEGLALVNV